MSQDQIVTVGDVPPEIIAALDQAEVPRDVILIIGAGEMTPGMARVVAEHYSDFMAPFPPVAPDRLEKIAAQMERETLYGVPEEVSPYIDTRGFRPAKDWKQREYRRGRGKRK